LTSTKKRVILYLTTKFRSKGDHVIKKVKGGYKVVSSTGKNLGGPYKSKASAAKRLKQVEYFKNKKKGGW
jgi:hypothetical protein